MSDVHHREAVRLEGVAAFYVASAAHHLSGGGQVYQLAEVRYIMADHYEQLAHQATRAALQCWRLHWAKTHCVEHADCRVHPELAAACLKGRG